MAKFRKRRMTKMLAVLSLAGIMSTMGVGSLTASAVNSEATDWSSSISTVSATKIGTLTAPTGTLTVKGVAETNGLTGDAEKNLVVVAHKIYDFSYDASGVVTATRTTAGLGFTAESGEGKTEYLNPTEASIAQVANTIAQNQSTYAGTSILMTRQENGDYTATNAPAGMYMILVYNTSVEEWYNPLLLSINVKWGTGTGVGFDKKADAELGVDGDFSIAAGSTGYVKKGTADITVEQTESLSISGVKQPKWKVTSAIPQYTGYSNVNYAIDLVENLASFSFYDDADGKRAFTLTDSNSATYDYYKHKLQSTIVKVNNEIVTDASEGVSITADRVEFSSDFAVAHAGQPVTIEITDEPYNDMGQTSWRINLVSGQASAIRESSGAGDTGIRYVGEVLTANLSCTGSMYDTVTDTDSANAWYKRRNGVGGSDTVCGVKKVDDQGRPLSGAILSLGGENKVTDGTGIVTWADKNGTVAEIQAPPGYAVTSDTVSFSFSANLDEGGDGTLDAIVTTPQGAQTISWNVNTNDETGEITVGGGRSYIPEIVDQRLTIIELPTTGGVGTIIFTIGIAVICGVAFVAFVKLRKKATEE